MRRTRTGATFCKHSFWLRAVRFFLHAVIYHTAFDGTRPVPKLELLDDDETTYRVFHNERYF